MGLDYRVGGAKMLIKQSLTQRVVCQLSVSTREQIDELHERLSLLMQNANELRRQRELPPFTRSECLILRRQGL